MVTSSRAFARVVFLVEERERELCVITFRSTTTTEVLYQLDAEVPDRSKQLETISGRSTIHTTIINAVVVWAGQATRPCSIVLLIALLSRMQQME